MSFKSSFVLTKSLSVVFLAVMLTGGLTAKAQPYYTIDFPFGPPPPVTDPNMDRNDGPLPDGNGSSPFNVIETGVRFRVTVPGKVTAIRFYKGLGQRDGHYGHLWTNDGNLIEQVSFSNLPEAPSGWLEEPLDNGGFHITPADTFVVSIFSLTGDYAADNLGRSNWFGTPGNDFGTNPNPIRVIAYDNTNEPDGYTGNNNGIYDYFDNPPATDGQFPTTGNGVNFYVDFVFLPDPPLPVSLTDFKATTAISDILLSWKTQSEQNNRGFEIQRSNNGADWYAINFINGTGESTVTKNYSYTDKALAPGTYYYRVNQKDMDGKSTYSAIASAAISGKGIVSLFQNYPNPFTSITSIRFDLPRTQHARLSLLDMSGRELKVLTDKVGEAGSHVITLDATSFVRQTYLIRLQTDNGIITRKIVVR